MNEIVFELRRRHKGANFTHGVLYYEGTAIADTIEPKWRDYANGEKKVPGKSAIRAKEYPIFWGYSYKFQGNRIFLDRVDNFTGVMIHEGNSFINTQGCILVGEKYHDGTIDFSKNTLRKVHECYKDWLKKHPTWGNGKINIIDDFDNG